jgi:ketosteroid isomerase-like protein
MTRYLASVLLVAAACTARQAPSNPTATIAAMLESSAAAWNGGDLDRFMSDYVADTMTSFIADGRPHYGFDWIRARYAPGFEPGAPRDSLRFVDVAARSLGTEYILATARYVLFRGDSTTSSGPFTLVLHLTAGNWKIIHDHTHTDPR